MEVKAIAKDTGVSSRKVWSYCWTWCGEKRWHEALVMLKFTASPPKAKYMAKVVSSAAANAENNFQMTPPI